METDDLRKLYNNIYMDQSTLSCLANRVQMNIKLYGCPRTNENMESMTKDTLVIRTYADTGRRYVMKMDNISGNIPKDREMPEYCPFRNIETYLENFHPRCNRLCHHKVLPNCNSCHRHKNSSTSLVQMRAIHIFHPRLRTSLTFLYVNYDDSFCGYNTLTTVNSNTRE